MSAGSAAQGIASFKTETVVNGTRLHYWIGGDPKGMPVLLWHGFLGTAYSWHKVMPLLAEAGFSILVTGTSLHDQSDRTRSRIRA
jgi:pimeloyl-ACP methyl ester carboxylesterase